MVVLEAMAMECPVVLGDHCLVAVDQEEVVADSYRVEQAEAPIMVNGVALVVVMMKTVATEVL